MSNTFVSLSLSLSFPDTQSNTSARKKQTATTTTSSKQVLVEVDATLCPICDEACTCPKTSLLVAVKGGSSTGSSSAKNNTSHGEKKSAPKRPARSQQVKRPALPVILSAGESTSADEADQALSFIKMIYSDEESLDEEEAYALYQATQLFSSSSEDEEYFYYQQQLADDYGTRSNRSDQEESESDDDEYGSESESDGYAYTVVEYVNNPARSASANKKSSAPSETVQASAASASASGSSSDAVLKEDSNGGSGDWTTWSVFDIGAADDSEVITIQTNLSPSVLSSTGAGTPETLLFSTSAADKIPNIAPQVLAAISAAAKSMAAGGTGQAATKYFSYITTVANGDANDDESGEGEFLFFEEGSSSSSDQDSDTDGEGSISLSDYDPVSDGDSSGSDVEDACSVTSTDSFEQDTFTSALNRWNRVPIGAFRRSRRLSLPRVIHPSLAMKAAVDPSAVTLTAPLLAAESIIGGSGLDHPCELQRAYSVITLDELNIDISKSSSSSASVAAASSNSNETGCSHGSCFQCSSPVWPAPKRSKSVIPTSSSISEWNNWHWEI